MHRIFSFYVVKIESLNKIITNKSHRCIHNTTSLKVRTRISVNEYLLNRSVPASDILNKLTEEDEMRLSNIKDEYNLLLTNGELVPRVLTDKHLLELLCLSRIQRLTYLRYLSKIEFSKINHQEKIMQNSTKEKYIVGFGNTFLGKYFARKKLDLEVRRAYQAIVLKNQKIVFDFSFENDMSRREVKESVKQLSACYAFNRKLPEPFQIGIVNLQPGSITFSDMQHLFLSHESNRYEKFENFPFLFDQRPLTEVYSRKEIIYLSPNSSRSFDEGEYDHDAVYVIGAIVDKSEQYPLTLAKARKEGLKTRALPLDRHVKWVTGNKNLPFRQVFEMLAIASETNGNWEAAVKFSLPPRVVTPFPPRKKNENF